MVRPRLGVRVGFAALLAQAVRRVFPSLPPFTHRSLTHGPRDANTLALTFDDGPSYATKEVLNILGEAGVTATFFMVGENVRRMPGTARMVSADGHEVAAHSDKHSRLLPYLLPSRSGRDAARSASAVEAATDIYPRYYRPPHGKSSPWMRRAIARQGLEVVGWEVDGGDWKRRSSERIAQEIVGNARPGSIVLLHDGLDLREAPDRSAMLSALPNIIDGLRGRGYSLVTVGELLGPAARSRRGNPGGRARGRGLSPFHHFLSNLLLSFYFRGLSWIREGVPSPPTLPRPPDGGFEWEVNNVSCDIRNNLRQRAGPVGRRLRRQCHFNTAAHH